MGHLMGAAGVYSKADRRLLMCAPDSLGGSAEDGKHRLMRSALPSVTGRTTRGRHDQILCCHLTEKGWSLSIHQRGHML
jgi:hypothetical protein